MKKSKLFLILLAIFLLCGLYGTGAEEKEESSGPGLVKQLWDDMKNADVEAISKYISPQFQSIHEDGPRNRDEQLELIENLDLGEYILEGFFTTENDNIIVVSYFVTVEETLEGKRLPGRKSARLSAWQKTENGCKWIIHANLRTMQ